MKYAISAAICAMALAGCEGGIRGTVDPNTPGGGADPTGGTFNERSRVQRVEEVGRLGDLIAPDGILGGSNNGQGLNGSVNRYLWRASLDTLSFLPLNSTDPFSGVIATDWSSAAEAPLERFKVTAYVTGLTLDPDSVQVAVFREQRDEAGQWVTAAVSPVTARQLEDSILTRARQLRIADN